MKRYTVAPSTLIEVEEGYIVLHSDYAVLESKFKTACTQNKALLSQRNSILARHNALVEAVSPVVEDWVATRPKVVDSEGYVIILRAEQLDALVALVGEEK